MWQAVCTLFLIRFMLANFRLMRQFLTAFYYNLRKLDRELIPCGGRMTSVVHAPSCVVLCTIMSGILHHFVMCTVLDLSGEGT